MLKWRLLINLFKISLLNKEKIMIKLSGSRYFWKTYPIGNIKKIKDIIVRFLNKSKSQKCTIINIEKNKIEKNKK